MNRHIIDAARALKDEALSRRTASRKVHKASHRASSAAGMGDRPVRPLAKMDRASARIAGERKYSLEVVLSLGRTSIHAPHMRERDVVGRLDNRDTSLAGRKF